MSKQYDMAATGWEEFPGPAWEKGKWGIGQIEATGQWGLGVKSAHRGEGIGRALIKEAMIRGVYSPDSNFSKGGAKTVISAHREILADALSRGLPVPPEVLADYPDLASQYGPQEGDTNAEGLVFHDGHWRREEDPRPQRNRHGLGGAKVPGVEYVRAKPGGETSPVDGRFYKGGQLMPVHGLYSGMEKVKGSGKQVGTPVQADPNAKGKDRTPAQPMSPEMIEERRREAEHRKQWQEIKQSPLGRMKFLGESPSHKVVADGRTDLKGWMEFSKELGPARLESLISALEAALPEKDREYLKDDARHQAGYDAQSTPSARKHEREAPGSLYARQLLGSMMSEGKSLESMYKAAQILSAVSDK